MAFSAGEPLDRGAVPDWVFRSAHKDSIQVELQTLSNAIFSRITIGESVPGIASGQGVFVKDNDVFYDVLFRDFHLNNRSEESWFYSFTIGNGGSGLGELRTHNIHVENVDGVTGRIEGSTQFRNSYWFVGRALNPVTGDPLDGACYPIGVNPSGTTPMELPNGLQLVDYVTVPQIPEDYTNGF